MSKLKPVQILKSLKLSDHKVIANNNISKELIIIPEFSSQEKVIIKAYFRSQYEMI